MESLCHSTLDLRATNASLCGHFLSGNQQLVDSSETCLGYVETGCRSQLVFYNAGSRCRGLADPPQKDFIQLKKILGGLDTVRQLRLALKVSRAVLSFHNTSWLPPDWQLQDMAFFGQVHQDLDNITFEDMETLHLTTQIPNRSQCLTARDDSLSVTQPPTTEHESSTFNIRNLTLANLGIALLEIGLKKDIRRFRRSNEPNNIVTARKLADGFQSPLGPQYQSILRKCIHCDFAFGADLKTRELQDAVYSDVICGIEGLIKSCEDLVLG
jgi:hypothetical protein